MTLAVSSSPPRATTIASYVSALVIVYTILIIAYILSSMFFAFGGRVPYTRWSSAVLGFLRDVCEPYLGIFRRFIPPLGPIDLSPIVAILVLQIVGGIIVQPDPGLSRMAVGAWGRVAFVAAGVVALDQATKALVRATIEPGDRVDVVPGVELVHTRNSGVAFGALSGGGAIVTVIVGAALVALLGYFATHVQQAAGSGCRPGCSSAARSATSSTASARARSRTSSRSRSASRRSTSPTCRSRSASSLLSRRRSSASDAGARQR